MKLITWFKNNKQKIIMTEQLSLSELLQQVSDTAQQANEYMRELNVLKFPETEAISLKTVGFHIVGSIANAKLNPLKGSGSALIQPVNNLIHASQCIAERNGLYQKAGHTMTVSANTV